MRIVMLDGHTLNPGDLGWQPLEALGECAIYERSQPDEVLARARGAEILVTNKVVLSRQTIGELPQLKYIGVTATGVNIVDLEAARERSIPVTNVPAYGTPSVAQMTFAHLLNLTQRVAAHAETVREGRWAEAEDFCYWDYPLIELAGLTMGIVGFGQIGRAVSDIARAFGMRVLANAPTARSSTEGVRLVDLETLLRESDVVSLHCPLTPKTERLINRERLGMMKKTAFLINTSRGLLIDEAALVEALEQEQIAGAGLDVLAAEPPAVDHRLVRTKNCYVTPHIAWATRAARQRLLHVAADNVQAFLAGTPQNVVNR